MPVKKGDLFWLIKNAYNRPKLVPATHCSSRSSYFRLDGVRFHVEPWHRDVMGREVEYHVDSPEAGHFVSRKWYAFAENDKEAAFLKHFELCIEQARHPISRLISYCSKDSILQIHRVLEQDQTITKERREYAGNTYLELCPNYQRDKGSEKDQAPDETNSNTN